MDEAHRGLAAIDDGETAKCALGHGRHAWHPRPLAVYLVRDGVPATPRVAGGTGRSRGASGRAADLGRHRRDGRAELRAHAARRAAGPDARAASFRAGTRRTAASGSARACRYTRVIHELGDRLPGLAMASRTVGSPQIRNRGTIGGNLGSSSPAGDALPPLFAGGAEVELASARGVRRRAGRRLRRRAEAQRAGRRRADRGGVDAGARGRGAAVREGRHAQRDGDRGLLVRARRVATGASGTCIGSAGPTPLRAREAEAFAGGLGSACSEDDAARSSASWSRRRPRRSTTCAAPPPTGATRWACWRGGR